MQKYEKRTKLGKTKTVFDTDSTSKTKEETDDNRWSIDTAQCLQLLEALRTAQDIAFVEWPQRGEDTRCMANDYPRKTTVENFTVWPTPFSKKPTSSPKSLPTMSSAFFARALTPFRKDSNLIDTYPCPSSPFLTITISGNRTAISSASFGAFFGFHATTNRTEAEFT